MILTKLGDKLMANRRKPAVRNPTEAEKVDFAKQVMITLDKTASEETKAEAEAKIRDYMVVFDCGCSFRDAMFKSLYNAVRNRNSGQASLQVKLLMRSFKYDSLKGLAKKLGF